MDAYEHGAEGLKPDMRGVHERITYLIDGINTEGEIIRKMSLEQRCDMGPHVRILLDLYRELGLIEAVGNI